MNQIEKTAKTASVMISCVTLSWPRVKPSTCSPMRLAGTWKQYSKNAIPQLSSTTAQTAACFPLGNHFRCPDQAKVMKMLEMVRRTTVRMVGAGCGSPGYRHDPPGDMKR